MTGSHTFPNVVIPHVRVMDESTAVLASNNASGTSVGDGYAAMTARNWSCQDDDAIVEFNDEFRTGREEEKGVQVKGSDRWTPVPACGCVGTVMYTVIPSITTRTTCSWSLSQTISRAAMTVPLWAKTDTSNTGRVEFNDVRSCKYGTGVPSASRTTAVDACTRAVATHCAVPFPAS